MNYPLATPSTFSHPYRTAMVIGALALLVLLGFSHSSLLRAVVREQRDAERRFRESTRRRADIVLHNLLRVEGMLLAQASPELLPPAPREPDAASVARFQQALAPLVAGGKPETQAPFSQVLLLDGEGVVLAQVGAPDVASPTGYMGLVSAQGKHCGLGSLRSVDGKDRLALVAVVSPNDGQGIRLLAVLRPRLGALLASVRPCADALGGFALALMEPGLLAQSNAVLPAAAFTRLLAAPGGFDGDFAADMGNGRRLELAGCWVRVGNTPLLFAQLGRRQTVVGLSSPTLVITSAVISGGVICALLAMVFVIAWQHDRAVREHVELARLDLELQERLREARRAEDDTKRLTRAFDNAGEPVMVTDRWGVLEYVNRAFEKLIGFPSAEVVGKRLVDFVPPDEAQRLEPLIARSHKTIWSRRIRCRHRDGERLRLDITVSPVAGEEGRTVANYIVLARDVRGDMQLEERALQARKLEAVGRLAGGLAHDFNNVLQVILGYAGEMMESVDQPEQRDSLGQILAAGRLGSELTSRLIAFSRQQISHREIANVNETIRACAPGIQKRLGGNVDLQLALEPMLWDTLLDATRFEQVLVQLAENARDATPDGGTVTICTRNLTLREPIQTVISDLPVGDYVRTDVIDTGRGISPEDLEQIFEPLFTTRQQGGLKGLGLCVVHGTIAQHGGGIIVESTPGQGTTFQVYLPRCVDPSQKASPDAAEILAAQRGEGKVILLAEDEEPVRHVAARLLAKVGYEVLEAVDGRDAIAKFDAQRDQIDLALLDIVMPGVSGAVVADHIRRTSPETPLLFCSGYAKHQLPDGIDLPADIPLIGKPYEPRRLLAAIAKLLRDK